MSRPLARILVLGSNSFSGAHLVDMALSRNYRVVGISRSTEPDPAFLPYRSQPEEVLDERFSFYQYDLNHDLSEIASLATEFKPDYIVNFAAQGMVAESWAKPEQWYQTNLVAAVQLHERLRKLPGLRRFVQISTPEVYGSSTGLVTESAPCNPTTPYAVSKAACDMSLSAFFRHYGFPVVFTRAANVFGPGQQLYRIVPKTIMAIKKGERVPLHGGGHSLRSFIHIRDVIEATLAIAERGVSGQAYNLATDHLLSIRELVGTICRLMGADFEQVVSIADERPGKDMAYSLDSSRARSELGWRPRIALDEAITETIEWVESNLETLAEHPDRYIHKP
jgi:dTDP-glucose 4,6-dehydratase